VTFARPQPTASDALCFHGRAAGALLSLLSPIASIALALLLPPDVSLDISILSIADCIADPLQTAREKFCNEPLEVESWSRPSHAAALG
jgi:hypothetical protein